MKYFILILLVTLIGCNNIHHPESINTDSIDVFWAIAETLGNDIEPDQEQWDSLFSTLGLSTFTARELPVDWMKSYMTKGIMPSMESERIRWKEAGFYDYKFLVHFAEIAERKEDIDSFISELKSHDILDEAFSLMEEFWPEEIAHPEMVPMALLFFDKDARGYDPILFDALYAHEAWTTGNFERLAAHEAHHYCRNKLLSFENPVDSIPDSKIIWMLNQVHAEGIADLIDKPQRFSNPIYAKTAKRYYTYLSDTPNHLQKLDSMLIEYSSNESMELAKLISRTAPNSGHPMGYYMARTILDIDGKDALLTDIGNPFTFFIRYNEAAKKLPERYVVLSEPAINKISELERKYRISSL